MKRIFILFALALSYMTAMATTYTVYYDNSTTEWSTVYVYAFHTPDGNVDITNGWHGNPMTNMGNGIWKAEITADDNLTNPKIVFNNNDTSQTTPDFDFVDGATYTCDGTNNSPNGGIVYTVYFDNYYNWSGVHCWIWSTSSGGNDVENDAWASRPALDYDTTTGLWYHTFSYPYNLEADGGAGLKFTNSDDTDDTDDITPFVNNGVYYPTGETSGGVYSGHTVEDYTRYTYTVYYDTAYDDTTTDDNWNPVYVYIWDGTSEVTGGFPGAQMTLTSGTLWSYTISTPVQLTGSAQVIFGDGISGENNVAAGNQTNDLAFQNGATYGYSGENLDANDANWYIYFDPSDVQGDVYSVEVHLWHSEYGDAEDDFERTVYMTLDETEGSDTYGYWVYSFYSDDAILDSERIEVEFIVHSNARDTDGTKYGLSTKTDTQISDWYLENNAVYGVSGFIEVIENTAGYTRYTIYYKQSENPETDGNWSNVYIYVFDGTYPSLHFTSNRVWPGDKMTYIGNRQWKYSLYGPEGGASTIGLVLDFNDGITHGTGEAGASTQTSDLYVHNNGLYEHHWGDDETLNKGVSDEGLVYIVGAEIYVSAAAGYATYYGDEAYVMPAITDHCGNKNANDGHYFSEDMHGTTVSTWKTGSDADDESMTGYVKTAWEFGAGDVVPAGTALLLHSEKRTGGSDDAVYGDTDITGETAHDVTINGRYYLARVPSEEELETLETLETSESDNETPAFLINNMLYGSSYRTWTTNGVGSTTNTTFYMLSTDENGENLGFYYGADNGAAFISEANKAWLAVPDNVAGDAKAILIDLNSDVPAPTGITTVSPQTTVKSDAIYNLQGMRVNDMSKKGIYIVGGRKVVVR